MEVTERSDLTLFLRNARSGAVPSNDRRWPIVYRKLREIAGRLMFQERKDHTLSVDGLIHETYLRLFSCSASWQNRDHFYKMFSRTMKRTLIDYARNRNSMKRQGRKTRLSIGEEIQIADIPEAPALELRLAVERLASLDPRLAQVIELRFYRQMSIQEIAMHFSVSKRTIDRELNRAKLLLLRLLIVEHVPRDISMNLQFQ